MDAESVKKWLDAISNYFETRDTHGEDRAHWANVYNAAAARNIKAALSAAEARIKRLEEARAAALTELALFEFYEGKDREQKFACVRRAHAALEGKKK